MNGTLETPRRITSADGTDIAYEAVGSGPPVILVGGAFNDRRSPAAGLPLARRLAAGFEVYAYDRRGRGDSGETPPYAVEREIEDLRGLAAEAGRPVALFGHSSGGALAIQAVLAGLEVRGLAVFEPPYTSSEDAEARSRATEAELQAFLAAGRKADAAAAFLTSMGMPPARLSGLRSSPAWAGLESMAPTLAYDLAVLRRRGSSAPPLESLGRIGVPVLGLAGSLSPEWMREVTRAITAAAPAGEYREIEGVDHAAPGEVIATELLAWLRAHAG
jgi:pimeloyl-ACP methyl ester carboxylesterase